MRYIFFTLCLTLLTINAGCNLLTLDDDESAGPDAVEIVNASDQSLYVRAYAKGSLEEETLEVAWAKEDVIGPVVESGGRTVIALDGIGARDTVAFMLYAGDADGDVLRLAGMLPVTGSYLDECSSEVIVESEHLDDEFKFGETYQILRETDGIPEARPPEVIDGELSLWVSYTGCDTSAFALACEDVDAEPTLRLIRASTNGDLTCERMRTDCRRIDQTPSCLSSSLRKISPFRTARIADGSSSGAPLSK